MRAIVRDSGNGLVHAARVLDSADDIGEWLDVDLLNAQGEKGEPPDMFVVGFQEVRRLSRARILAQKSKLLYQARGEAGRQIEGV